MPKFSACYAYPTSTHATAMGRGKAGAYFVGLSKDFKPGTIHEGPFIDEQAAAERAEIWNDLYSVPRETR